MHLPTTTNTSQNPSCLTPPGSGSRSLNYSTKPDSVQDRDDRLLALLCGPVDSHIILSLLYIVNKVYLLVVSCCSSTTQDLSICRSWEVWWCRLRACRSGQLWAILTSFSIL